jgi:kinesin family protein 5
LSRKQSIVPTEDSEARSPGLRTGNSIKVVARFRPLNDLEKLEPQDFYRFEEDSVQISLGKDFETFILDRVYQPGSSQAAVFDFVGKSIIEDVIGGYNGTVLAYGQTGTGKTYTMMGDDFYNGELKGITPRAASQIFETVSRSDAETEYIFKCSMLEIYKEKLRDLLNPDPTSLRIKECPVKGIYVQGLTEVCVTSEEEMMEVISLGEQMRTVAMTKLNPMSSRSHQLFVMEARQKSLDGSEKRGVLNLVDLAGSEKVNHSGVTGNSLEETKKINLSLSALGNVIHALTSRCDHVPYRDSKLTRLLEESLGGNYKTTLIVTCSPHARNLDETLNTLRFSVRAKNIKNRAHVNIKSSPDDLQKMIKLLQTELFSAKQEIMLLRTVKTSDSSAFSEFRPTTPQPSSSRLSLELIRTLPTASSGIEEPITAQEHEMSPKPSSIDADSLNSSLVIGSSDQRNRELSKLRILQDYYEAKVSSAAQEVKRLNEEAQHLMTTNKELEAKVASSRAKQLAAEKRAHEYSEQYHRTLGLISKDSAENTVLKLQVSGLQRQVKRLAASLQDMEFRFGVSLSRSSESMAEFEDQSHRYMCEGVRTRQDDKSNDSALPDLSFATRDLPLDTASLMKYDHYAEIVQLTSPREALVYTLRNQLAA